MNNVIENGNFEGEKLAPWELDPPGGSPVFIRHGKGNSILLPEGLGITQTFAYKPAPMRVTFKVKAPDNATDTEVMYVFGVLWQKAEGGLDPAFSGGFLYTTSQWVEQEINFQAVPEMNIATIAFRAATPGERLLDAAATLFPAADGPFNAKHQNLKFGPVEFADFKASSSPAR